jgi:NADPH-dependent 7-cyano-7-deazaguanine reductase QueF
MNLPLKKHVLTAVLQQAGNAHHEYETRYLGEKDPDWAGWYAAYVLEKMGHFTTQEKLTRWLRSVPDQGDWHETAADAILKQLHT